MPKPIPKIRLKTHKGVLVVRDDRLHGGTKRRALQNILEPGQEYVYASPAVGFAQVALAITAKEVGARATIFTAQRKVLHDRTVEAQDYGAKVVLVPHGYLSVVEKRAREYCFGALLGKRDKRHKMPFGLDYPMFINAIANAAKSLDLDPDEVWCVAGSGVLTRSLQKAWPNAKHNAVRVGSEPDAGKAKLYEAPEKYEQHAKSPPPFPSCANYDAKAWQFVMKHKKGKRVLFWNVAQ